MRIVRLTKVWRVSWNYSSYYVRPSPYTNKCRYIFEAHEIALQIIIIPTVTVYMLHDTLFLSTEVRKNVWQLISILRGTKNPHVEDVSPNDPLRNSVTIYAPCCLPPIKATVKIKKSKKNMLSDSLLWIFTSCFSVSFYQIHLINWMSCSAVFGILMIKMISYQSSYKVIYHDYVCASSDIVPRFFMAREKYWVNKITIWQLYKKSLFWGQGPMNLRFLTNNE